jgi:hypothetical protein
VLPFKKEISKTEEKEEEEKEGNIFMYFFLREGHKLLILFPQPPEYWDYRNTLPCLASQTYKVALSA